MSELTLLLEETLSNAIRTLGKSPWRDEAVPVVTRLKEEINAPCTVAVVGEVSAGKSTFVNALLEGHYAKTGATETTATLTYFRYGAGSQHGSVRCHWQNGQVTDETLDFVHGLQSSNEEAREQAEAIEFVEVFLDNAYLRDVVLIDTPGTGTIIDLHKERTSDICLRRTRETEESARQATAVIYLLRYVATTQDAKFLDTFEGLAGGQANPLNSVGVMAQIDRSDEVLKDAAKYASSLHASLERELNAVCPVSALLHNALTELNCDGGLEALRESLLRIPPEERGEMLTDRDLFDLEDYESCPLTPKERKSLRRGIEWPVFKLIATTILEHESEEALRILDDYSGFKQLRATLQEHFFKRAQLLQCYHVAARANRYLDELIRGKLPDHMAQSSAEAERKRRFLRFVDEARDQGTASELREWIEEQFPASDEAEVLEKTLEALQGSVEGVIEELSYINNDFHGLQLLHGDDTTITEDERIELRNLFGQHGLSFEKRLRHLPSSDTTTLGKRQVYWRNVAAKAPLGSPRRTLAEHAHGRYGRLLGELVCT